MDKWEYCDSNSEGDEILIGGSTSNSRFRCSVIEVNSANLLMLLLVDHEAVVSISSYECLRAISLGF